MDKQSARQSESKLARCHWPIRLPAICTGSTCLCYAVLCCLCSGELQWMHCTCGGVRVTTPAAPPEKPRKLRVEEGARDDDRTEDSAEDSPREDGAAEDMAAERRDSTDGGASA